MTREEFENAALSWTKEEAKSYLKSLSQEERDLLKNTIKPDLGVTRKPFKLAGKEFQLLYSRKKFSKWIEWKGERCLSSCGIFGEETPPFLLLDFTHVRGIQVCLFNRAFGIWLIPSYSKRGN